ncbi:GNAT family N-acetyltransferase [Plastoroseomonas arctica]|uniref:N-acetyltransferase domain-containing protein n=1 Tax=Plastoroseomonas arctica TaxID=1509237 RepID=A0AAF1JZJ2_9PROT|nr:hypothetical protein [Plastoroseomonas arctica]MBR0654354.1 hypothetical protein [Plastoroseomonas arctica]
MGRIAACVDGGGPGIGSFGFLQVEQDGATLAALLDTARAWLAARGMTRLRGPLSFTINHEVGVQVAGFDSPTMLRMPRNPPWLSPMLEAQGLAPEKDVVACTLDLAREVHRARAARLLSGFDARLRIRALDPRDWPAEVARLAALFNDAWAENWGFMPIGDAEAAAIAKIMRPIARTSVILFAEWDGAPIGVLAMLPNIEEARGSWRMLPAMLFGRVGSARIAMLGVSRAFRGTLASSAATAMMLSTAFDAAERRGWRRIEISWILEDNAAMLALMARLPAPVTGRWRIHGGPI